MRKIHRIIAIILSAAMLLGSMVTTVPAEEIAEDHTVEVVTPDAEAYADVETETEAAVEAGSENGTEAETEVELPEDEVPDSFAEDEIGDTDNVSGYVTAPYEEDYESVSAGADDSFFAVTERKYISPIARQFPTKSQGPFGVCWAFSSTAAAEMSAAKYGVTMPGGQAADASVDLSKLHLAYFAGNGLEAYDPLGGLNGDKNGVPVEKNYLQYGGSVDNASHLLASWIGPADENKYPYGSASSFSTDRTNAVDDVLHLKNFYIVAHKTDRDAVKKLIQDYGMVTASYCALKNGESKTEEGVTVTFSQAYSSENNCYYMPIDSPNNHAISIIGWDDDFSKEKFAYPTKPEGDGAWLVRNSWVAGVSVDENGDPIGTSGSKYQSYFWLSYYDKSMLSTCCAFDMEPLGEYDNNYQYDGAMTGAVYSAPTGFANIYTAGKDAEILEAVYFSTHSANVEYTIDIYKGVTLGNPTSGTHVVRGQTGKTTYAGGYTIKLDTPVDLKKGETFSVVLTVPTGTKMDIEGPSKTYATVAYTETGRSIYYQDGKWKTSSNISIKDVGKCGDFRIKAFTANAVATTFDANGGKIGTDATVTKNYKTNSKYGSFPEVTRTGYDFNGWFTAATGGDKVTADDAATTERTLYAQWTPKKYTITFDPNGGTCTPASIEVEYDAAYGKLSPLPVPERSGYGFDGWYTAKTGGTRITDETVVSITAAQTLYAHWDANKYTVTFDANGGMTSESSRAVTYGSKYGTLPTATRVGYRFDGWFTEKTGGTKITNSTVVSTASAHTLYAQWSVNNYTVTLDARGGKFQTAATKTITVTFGGKYGALDEPTRDGYDFDGWYTEEAGGTRITADSIVEIGANHRLYAHWDGHFFDITFDPQGGQAEPLTKNVKNGTPYGTLPVPEKEGSDFIGWYTAAIAGKRITEDTIVDITSPVTLFAHYDVRKITITADANGGSFGGDLIRSVYVDWGNKVTSNDITQPSRRRYDFTGWYSDSACTAPFDFDKELKADVTIYAGWAQSGYKGFKIEDLNSDRYEYNGSSIRPAFSVYYYDEGVERKLNNGTDYSVTYTNNVNAGPGDPTGKTGPAVTVKGRGNYADTISAGFDIDPVDMSNVYMDADDAVDSGKTSAHIIFVYNGKVQKLDPVLKVELSSGKTVTLKKGTDYKFIQKVNGTEKVVDGVKAVGDYDISITGIRTITGKGNYAGTRPLKVSVIAAGAKSFAKVNLPAIPNQTYYDGYAYVLAGEPGAGEIRAKDKYGNPFEWVLTDSSVKPAYTLQYGRDYDLSYSDNIDAGTATVTVIGKGNYAGTVSKTFKIEGTAMSKVTVPANFGTSTAYKKYYDSQTKKFSYFGGEFEVAGPANIGKDKWNNETYGIELYYNGVRLDKGDDYTVTYAKNIEPGTASVIFTGKGRYSGSVKKTFGIQSLPMDSNIEGYTVKIMTVNGLEEWDPAKEYEFAFVKGGVKPVPVVMLEDIVLTEGVDYKLSWSNYSKPARYNETNSRGKSIAPTVTITGKGYFKGKTLRTYTIKKGELAAAAASDVAYTEGKTGNYSKTKIYCDGQELRSGTDIYSLTDRSYTTFTFVSFDGDAAKTTGAVMVKDGKNWTEKTVKAGDVLEKTYSVLPGTVIKVNYTGKGSFAGQKGEAEFSVAANDFSKTAVKIEDFTYTGNEITPAMVAGKMTVTMGNKSLTYGEDYLISYMTAAKKVGTVKVTIKGNPEKGYAGQKTATFKIKSKSIK